MGNRLDKKKKEKREKREGKRKGGKNRDMNHFVY